MAWYDNLRDFFGNMSTEDKQRLAGGIMQTVGGGGEAAYADTAGRQNLYDKERYDRQIRGMGLSQVDPYTQARQRAMMDILRQGMQHYSPYKIVRGEGGGYTSQGGFGVPEGGFDMSSLDPVALDAALKSFEYNRAAINPFAPSQVEGVEPFRQAQLEDWLSRSGYDNYQGYDPTRTEYAGQGGKDFRAGGRVADESGNFEGGGGGGWKNWLKMAGNVALPIVTGGMSLPVQAAIMGGTGALQGALGGGGWKGALKGGAMGAGGAALNQFLTGGRAAKDAWKGVPYAPIDGASGLSKIGRAALSEGLKNIPSSQSEDWDRANTPRNAKPPILMPDGVSSSPASGGYEVNTGYPYNMGGSPTGQNPFLSGLRALGDRGISKDPPPSVVQQQIAQYLDGGASNIDHARRMQKYNLPSHGAPYLGLTSLNQR